MYIFLRRGTFYTVVVGRLGRTPERCRLPERQDVAKRVPVQTSGGFDGCVVVARLWRKEAREEVVARRGATLLAEDAEQARPASTLPHAASNRCGLVSGRPSRGCTSVVVAVALSWPQRLCGRRAAVARRARVRLEPPPATRTLRGAAPGCDEGSWAA